MKYIITTILLITNLSVAQICKTGIKVLSKTADSRFKDNGNGTISDDDTGLMWQKCQLGLSGSNCSKGVAIIERWNYALISAESSSIAGYNDWRLPNRKELLSIVEFRCRNPSINTTYFPNTSSSNFWSSSPVVYNSNFAWYVNFKYGSSYGSYRGNDLQSMRFVRSR